MECMTTMSNYNEGAIVYKYLPEHVRTHVDPDYIKEQRVLGWPDIHPEDYCHICGQANEIWYIDHNVWHIVTADWQTETGREGICCMSCFCDIMKEKAGQQVAVELRIDAEYLFRKLPHMEYLLGKVEEVQSE